MKLGLMMVLTPDLAEARDFSGDILGLRLTADTPSQLIFDVAGAELHLPMRRARPAAPPRRERRDDLRHRSPIHRRRDAPDDRKGRHLPA